MHFSYADGSAVEVRLSKTCRPGVMRRAVAAEDPAMVYPLLDQLTRGR